MTTAIYESQEFLDKLNSIIDRGLVTGLGKPEPGKFCAEAAVCYALGESHGDRPSCVHEADRALIVQLNDEYPGTNAERAIALRPLLLAHLGTVGHDRTEWVSAVLRGVIRVLLPIALNAAADLHPNVQHQTALRAAAKQCAENPDEQTAYAAADVAYAADYADYAAYAAAYAAKAAKAAYAAYAVASAAKAADYAAKAVASAAKAVASAAKAADYAAYAVASAAKAADSKRSVYDKLMQIVLDAYKAHPHR